jgi:hypothetical protein
MARGEIYGRRKQEIPLPGKLIKNRFIFYGIFKSRSGAVAREKRPD